MHGDFRPLVNPATWSDEIDIEGTKASRDAVHAHIRRQQRLLTLLRPEELSNDTDSSARD